MNTNANWIALLALVRKDLVIFFSNKRAVAILFIGPILIAAFFGSLFGGSGKKMSSVPVAITDLDNSALSKKIVAGLGADSMLALTTLPEADAIELVRKGKQRAAIVLPAGFGDSAKQAMFRGGTTKKPTIRVHHDPSQSMTLPMVNGILMQQVMRATMESTIDNPEFLTSTRNEIETNSSIPESSRRDLVTMFDSIARVQSQNTKPAAPGDGTASQPSGSGAARSAFDPPFSVKSEAVTSGPGREYNGYSQSFAGMSVQFVLFMTIDLAIALLLSRRSGMWKRLRAAPISRSVVLGASVISTTLIALVAMTVVFAAAIAFFGVQINGSVPGFVGIVVCFSIFTASYSLLLATVANSPEATRGLAVLATMLLVMLGGAWVPSFIFPEWLQAVSLILPTRWAIDGLAAMTWRGLGLDYALTSMAVLLAFTAAFTAVAVWRFRWEE